MLKRLKRLLVTVIDLMQRGLMWGIKFSLWAFGACSAVIVLWEIYEFLIAPVGIKQSSGPQPELVSRFKNGWLEWLIILIVLLILGGIVQNLKEWLTKRAGSVSE